VVDDHIDYLHQRWNEGTQRHRPVPGNHRPRLSRWRTGRAALPASLPQRAGTRCGPGPETTNGPRDHRLDHDSPRPARPRRRRPPAPGPETRLRSGPSHLPRPPVRHHDDRVVGRKPRAMDQRRRARHPDTGGVVRPQPAPRPRRRPRGPHPVPQFRAGRGHRQHKSKC
jgi:hypothetical protein